MTLKTTPLGIGISTDNENKLDKKKSPAARSVETAKLCAKKRWIETLAADQVHDQQIADKR